MRTRRVPVIFALLLTQVLTPHAAEYYVAPGGDDVAGGTTPEQAFATIQRGVDALEAGDTLTIAPGEYTGPVERADLGSSDQRTVIRAAIPGTVLIRGDVPLSGFSPVDGFRFVYAVDFDRPVHAVIERDTRRILLRKPALSELEFNPGSCYYDAEAGRLYIAPSDLRPARQHHYSASVHNPHAGLFLHRPVNVLVDGLAFTGFNNAELLSRLDLGLTDSDQRSWGLFLAAARDCEIRNVTAFLNTGGIAVRSGGADSDLGGNRIVDSRAYANAPLHGIITYQPKDDLMVGLLAYANQSKGVEYYASGGSPSRMEMSTAWGNGSADIQIKAGGPHYAAHIVGLDQWAQEARSDHVRNSFIGAIRDIPEQFVDNIVPDELAVVDWREQFADPDNLDFRLQSTSVFRGKGIDSTDLGPFPYEANVFYVGPDGDDSADGLSAATAWKTLPHAVSGLETGDTLYIEAGTYSASLKLQGLDSVHLRGRGTGAVILSNLAVEDGSNLVFERLVFNGIVQLGASKRIVVRNCRFGTDSGVDATAVESLLVEHCEFSAGMNPALKLRDTEDIHLTGNLYAGEGVAALDIDTVEGVHYSDYNAYRNSDAVWQTNDGALALAQVQPRYDAQSAVVDPVFEMVDGVAVPTNGRALSIVGPLGTPAGLYLPQRLLTGRTAALQVAGPFIHSITDTTANIEWWVSGAAPCTVSWGPAGELGDAREIDIHRFTSYSLSGLQPATEYQVRVEFDADVELLDVPSGVEQDGNSLLLTFTTAAQPHSSVVWYVAPDGSDSNNGRTAASPLRTLNRAAALALAGDTVLVAAGRYAETVRIRSTGDEGRPLTFRGTGGEVEINGVDRALNSAFIASYKTDLHFDHFYFREMGRNLGSGGSTPWSDRMSGEGAVVLYYCDDVTISRCFSDPRGQGYGPGLLQAVLCSDVTVENCVIMDAMGGGISLYFCPDTRIAHNVFLRNKIAHLSEAVNEPDQTIIFERNIVTDSQPSKQGSALFNIGKVDSLQENDNCYFFRIPATERKPFLFYTDVAYGRPAETWGMETEFADETPVAELQQLSLDEYRESYSTGSNSFAADPGFAATLGVDLKDRYSPDWLMGQRPLTFSMLFATNPEVVGRDIGLQRSAFTDD